jgi:Luciferase-like monooxygenase
VLARFNHTIVLLDQLIKTIDWIIWHRYATRQRRAGEVDKMVDISCNLMPSPAVVSHARIAEDLGYTRVYLADSPALYQDVWACLALVATATERIGLGTGVLVPFTRHPVVNAAAIATIEHLAPGRLVVGVGTGNSARRTLGHGRGSTLAYVRSYIEAMRALLRGQTAEWDGRPVALIPHPGHMPEFPIEVPILLSAFGPKGIAVALDSAAWIPDSRSASRWCSARFLTRGRTCPDPSGPSWRMARWP